MSELRSGGTKQTAVYHRLGPYGLEGATAFGPRITGLRRDGGPELLAVLPPELGIDNRGVGMYRFMGGHRLWVSPEIPEITHVPDEHPCLIEVEPGRLTVTAPADRAGFEKRISVVWDGTALCVDHVLRWTGAEPVTASPWAITQFPPGGVAVMPVTGPTAAPPTQANRSLVLWPYTRLDDPRIAWGPNVVTIDSLNGPQLKLGSGPCPSMLGYLRDRFLFVKSFDPVPGGDYPDRGAIAQVYLNDEFCELESLGPLTRLEPGGEVVHSERWQVHECPGLEQAMSMMEAV